MTEALVPPAGAMVAVWRRHRPIALATLCTVLFLTFLDTTVVSVALANIQTSLHAGVSELQWVVGAYALTFASAMLIFGMIGDQFGRKKVMLIGVSVYCLGALMCALAQTIAPSAALAFLLAGRGVMGLGAAASEPGTLSMLRHLYTEERSRNRALGVWAAVSGFSLALGPVLGGVLVGVWSWRGIFWFDITFGLAALAATAAFIPENADRDARRVDIAGGVFGAGALASLIFAVIDAESGGFASAGVVALLCISAASAVAFLWWETRASRPLLDVRYLRVPRFAVPNVVAFCAYFSTFAIFFFTALYLTEVAGYNGYQIAKVFLPMTALMITASLVAGRWTGVVGVRWSLVAGCALFAAGLLLTNATISPNPSYLPLAAALVLTGIGIGICVVPVTSSVLAAVPPERSGMAASATNTSREVGAVIGVAVLGALVNGQLHSELSARLNHLGIPLTFQSIVIQALETGGVPTNGNGSSKAPPGEGKLVQEVIHAAYSAFQAGLHVALYLSAGLMTGAGLLALVALRVSTTPAAKPSGTQPASASSS
ncbi:MAG TPA: MFS transporter [Streptosporangiaceae bacterium]|nr:MFS transporter [Streptosporangiaceae bacterium]